MADEQGQDQQTATLELPKDYSEFEKVMKAGTGPDPHAKEGGQASQTSPEKGAEAKDAGQQTGEQTNKEGEQSDDKDNPLETPIVKEHLTKLYKQRNKSRERVEHQRKLLSEKEAEVTALRAQLANGGAGGEPQQQQSGDQKTASAELEENDPIPEEKDYPNKQEFEEDMERWYSGEPLKRKPEKKDAGASSSEKKPEEQQQQDGEQKSGEAQDAPEWFQKLPPEEQQRLLRRDSQLQDLLVTCQKADPDDEWAGEFEDKIYGTHKDGGNQIVFSDAALEWMDEHPEDAVKVAKYLAENPEESRRIYRKRSTDAQIERLKAIAKPKTKKTDTNANDTQQGEGTNKVPPIDRLSGSNGQTDEPTPIEQIKDYGEFEKRMKAGK